MEEVVAEPAEEAEAVGKISLKKSQLTVMWGDCHAPRK